MGHHLELAAEPTAWQQFRAWPLRRTVATVYGTTVAALVVAVYLCSVLGALPRDPDAMDLTAVNALPSAAHPLGADFVGRDLLSRIMVGTQAFFLPGLLSVGVSLWEAWTRRLTKGASRSYLGRVCTPWASRS